MPESITPADLWDFAKMLASENDSDWETVLDPIGLLYSGDFAHYDATPTNGEVFATTGGDGTHFVLLDAPGNPVVMVVPMAFERAHVIVGDNLREFLCLGCKCGYFGLEQLAYDWVGTIEWIKDPDATTQGQTKGKVLHGFRQHFNLEPLPDPHKRLNELRHEHRAKIIVDSEFPFWNDLSK